MCGIAGIVGPGAENRQAVAAEMSSLIAHRGPDGSGLWTDNDAVLVHRRLAIIDLSPAGAQPMASACGRYVIVFNGEIYNYVELRDEMGGSTGRFVSGSDTEVLLAAWVRWGPRCVERLNGMFAFAIWDREERSLFAARDRFGEKPFYYSQTGDQFMFASEVKAFKAIPGFAWRANVHAVADFAAERVTDHTDGCFVEGVRQLRPGCWLSVKGGRVESGNYWSLDSIAPGPAADDDELRALLWDSVRIRLRADTPVGTLLSGGVDSSAITCLMAKAGLSEARYAYSTINTPPVAEAAGIAAVLDRYPRLMARHDHPTADQFWRDLPLLLWHQDEPFGDASMAAHFSLMRLARTTGVPVLLTGQGADEVFGGYESSLYHFLGSRFRRGGISAALAATKVVLRSPEILKTNVLYHALPLRVSRRVKRRVAHDLDWLSRDLDGVSSVLDAPERADEDPTVTYAKNLLRVRTLPGYLHYEDRNSMAFGVETRLPFLDHRLVEALLRIPPERRYEGGWTKARLRKIVQDDVPSSVLGRRVKMGYPAPLARWIRANRPAVEARTSERDFRECPLLDLAAWRRRADAFFRGDDREVHAVWRGYLIGLWHADILLGDGRRPCV